MAEPIVVETPAGQRRRLAALGVIMTAVSAFLVAIRSDGDVGLAVGLLGLVFFGPITLALLVRALRNHPVLILDADGFTDRSTLIAAGPVPWPDVSRIDKRPFMNRVFVAVTLTDPAAYRARQPAWRRLVIHLNRRLVRGDIFIPDNVLPMPPAELVKTMRRLQHAAPRRVHGGGTDRRA
jgi:hypothetical protein